MATSSSPAPFPQSSAPSTSSLYEDAPESCTESFQPSPAFTEEPVSRRRRYKGVQRNTRTSSTSLSPTDYDSTHRTSPYRAQKSRHKSAKSQSKRYIFSGSTNDKAMNTIIEQLETSMETYTDIQAQEALDLACASMRVLHAEEVYSIERLGEGRVQMRALENKVAEVKNRVRIADLQMVFLRQKLLSHGFVLSDHVEQDFVERLRRKPLVHSQLTEPELARISTPPANLDNPPTTATDLLLQEPFARPNISRWAHATLPGEPGVIITDNVDSNTSERDAESGEELESREPNVGPSGDIGGTL